MDGLIAGVVSAWLESYLDGNAGRVCVCRVREHNLPAKVKVVLWK